MAIAKLEFARKTHSEKITTTKGIVKSITGNAHFAKPDPTIAEINTSLIKFEDAHSAAKLDGGTKNMESRDKSEKELTELITRLVAYVQHESKGNAENIRSAGMDIKSDPVPTTSIEIPTAVEAYIGNPTEVDLVWKPIKKAISYEIQITLTPTDEGSWMHKGVSTKAKYTIAGLESGKKYWFRVSALGTRDLKSPYSDPATAMAG